MGYGIIRRFIFMKYGGKEMSCVRCGIGHYWIWAGDPNMKLPEGYPCACGSMLWHTETCACCGSVVNKPKPIGNN